MNRKETQDSQCMFEGQTWRTYTIWHQDLENCSIQGRVIVVKEQTNRPMEQKRVQKDSHKYIQLTFDEDVKAIQWRKYDLQQMVLKQLDIHMQKKMDLDRDLAPFTIIYSKWIIKWIFVFLQNSYAKT